MMKWTAESLMEHVKNPTTKCLVKFTADWCGPCQRIHTRLQQLYEESELTEMIVIDIDEEQEMAQQLGIRSIPKMIVSLNGQTKEINGANIELVEQTITELQQLTPLLGDKSAVDPSKRSDCKIDAVVLRCATVPLD